MVVADQRVAIEALAEYTLFQEAPSQANVAFLQNTFERAFSAPLAPDETAATILAAALHLGSPGWKRLLAPDTLRRLQASTADVER